MEAIQEYIDRKKKRVYFGIKMYSAMVVAGALAMILLAHGDIKRLWNEMSLVIVTTLTVFVALLISLVVIRIKMVLDLEDFTSEEQSRILREAGKMPQVYDFLITSDVLIFTIGYRVHTIALKDIVWAYGDTTERTQVYRSGGLFVPVKHSTHYLTVVLKNAKRIQVPLNASGKNWKAEVAYACKVIERKRPKAYLGYLPEMEHLTKEEFAAMVDFVEKGGTTNGGELEVQYGLNRWYQEEIPDYDVSLNENIHGAIRAEIEGVLFVVMLFGIVLAGLFFYFAPAFGTGDVALEGSQTNMWRFFAPAAVLAALLVAMIIVYIKTVVRHPDRRKYGQLHAVYIIMFIAWSLFFTSFLLLGSKKIYGEASHPMDRAGEAEETLVETDTQWRYGDIVYPKNPGIYGYEDFTKDEQTVFDFLYSRVKTKELEENGYHLKYQELVQKTVQAIQDKLSPDASEREKMNEIRRYFKKNCKPFNYRKWFNKISDDTESEENQKIYKKMRLARSGYGLLKTGRGMERAYMEAFGAVARGLGLSVIPVMNEDELQYWNKVRLDGKWYNIDLYQMAADPSVAKKYDLVSDRQMKQNGMENGAYGGEPSLELP